MIPHTDTRILIELFRQQTPEMRAHLLHKTRWLAESPASDEPTKQVNRALLSEMLEAETQLRQPRESPPEIPVLTWGMAARMVAPVLKVGTVATVGFGVLYAVGASVVGLAKGAHAWAVAHGGWVFGAACVGLVIWVVSKIEWGRAYEQESDTKAQNQQITVNVFTSQNGDVSVKMGDENRN